MDRRLIALPVLAVVFGSNFMFVKIAVDEASPLQIVASRLIIGATIIAAVMWPRIRSVRWDAPLLARVGVMAVMGTIVPFLLISWASETIDSGLASVLNSSMPLFTALFAAAAMDERLTGARAAGLLVGFAGVTAMTGYAALDVSGEALAAQLAVVAAAASFAATAVYSRGLMRTHDPIGLAGGQIAIAAVIAALIFAAAEGSPDYTLSDETWLALLFNGAVSGGLGYAAYAWLISEIGSVRASLITYAMPAVALFLGWVFLGESIGANTIGGMALILAGIAIVMRAPSARGPVVLRQPPAPGQPSQPAAA
jgi:drug/metabolite transporter (DMT)-like permease